MSNSLDFYSDAGLTTPYSRVDAVQSTDGAAPAVDSVLYLGSTAVAKQFQANSDPGIDQIVVSIANTGGSPANTAIRLALTSGGLDSATPGASLNVGTEILSGSENAIAVHVRIDAPALTAGNYDNLSLETNETIELSGD